MLSKVCLEGEDVTGVQLAPMQQPLSHFPPIGTRCSVTTSHQLSISATTHSREDLHPPLGLLYLIAIPFSSHVPWFLFLRC